MSGDSGTIARIETFMVRPRWLFVRIETDTGVVGWGEPIVEGRASSVAAVVDELSEYLIGQDSGSIEHHWQVLTKAGFYRGGPVLSSAVAGIDQALWDIAGKACGLPVHRLLGGPVRDKVRTYCWIGGDRPDELVEQALAKREAGYTAVKMNASAELLVIDTAAKTEAIVERVASVREKLGPDFDIAVDFHGRLSPAMSRRVLPRLEPLLPLFVEEPLVPELTSQIGSIAAATSIPIAIGERLYSRWDFKDILGSGIAVIQPDLSHAGGISEVRRIAAMGEAYGVALAPHCPLGPIALAASLQVDLVSSNFLIQEQSIGIHYNTDAELMDYLVDTSVFDLVGGSIALNDRPGLGIEIDEIEVRRSAESPHRWRAPVWRHADGGLAEW